MKSAEVRKKFLDYFAKQGHEIVPSSPLVPGNDPTLLFTNAGMVQFKEAFLGEELRACPRAASSQRCVRAGGKHNDLENVGYTARHHTFFEMLGNFSFGDYFKREAIHFGWEFLTEELGLPASKLWITVFETDDEAASIWLDEIKVDPQRFSRMGEKDNFWSMGDTGPCGPCSEIFYDHGESVAGGPPGSPDEDGDRYIEIWNLVFMQFDRQADNTMIPLPKPSVDTGMGLERVSAVLQGVHSNYEIDLFQPLLHQAAKLAGLDDINNNSLRVIADHIRSCTFLIVDGVVPSNEGRGYVLRRIVRRAVRHGYQLGVSDIFFYKLVTPLVEAMGDAYPELADGQAFAEKVLKEEEQQFARTVEHGMKILQQTIEQLDGKVIPGGMVFQLYDTFGFPVDLTADVAREHGLTLDLAGFNTAMEQQKNQARSASSFGAGEKLVIQLENETQFIGYESLEGEALIEAVYAEGKSVDELSAPGLGALVVNSSPFYGESGGQVGDSGILENDSVRFAVEDTQKQGNYLVHRGRLEKGTIRIGDKVNARVAPENRKAITLNHSATHLLHAALRQLLGAHVTQKGSLVSAGRLRFDFSHPSPLANSELQKIEESVNQQILANAEVSKNIMSMTEAKSRGAMALFGEKYGDEVRVVSMGGDFSVELCGGTHVNRTGDIGLFKIVSETGIAAGVRRIEAVTGLAALELFQRQESVVLELTDVLKTSELSLVEKSRALTDQLRKLEKEVEQLKGKVASKAGSDIAEQAIQVNGINLLAAVVEGFNAKSLRATVDQLKNKLGDPAVIVLATAEQGKVSLVAGVTKQLSTSIKAGELVSMVAQQVGGKGGGRADMAMAGGTDVQAVPGALESIEAWLQERTA